MTKPRIVKVTETPLEEKSPPTKDNYDFFETYSPPEQKPKKQATQTLHDAKESR